MSSEFLSSKVVVLEEEPQVFNITALPSTVVLCEGITERGPMSTPTLVTGWSEYWDTFGGFTVDSQVAIFAHCFFLMGGSFLWVSRTAHFTDITNKTSFIATKGAQMLSNAGATAVAGSVTCSAAETFDMRFYDGVAHNTLDLSVVVGGAPAVTGTATFAGTAADVTDLAVYTAGTRKLTFVGGGYTPVVPTDVGKAVVGAVSTDSGILYDYNNVTREWWVTPDAPTDIFGVAEAISITLGTGAGTTTGPSSAESGILPLALTAGEILTIKVNRGGVQTVTAVGGERTAADITNMIVMQLGESHADIVGGHVKITTDRLGTGAFLEVTGGTANVKCLFPTAEVPGGGNVFDQGAVTGDEVDTVIEAVGAFTALLDMTVDAFGHVTIATVATGALESVQVVGTSLADTIMGFDNLVHAGTTNTPAPTLNISGKTEGIFAANLSIIIEAATSLVATEFNMRVLENGAMREYFSNLTMDATALRYVQTIVNNTSTGSHLITATDQLLGLTPLQKRPVNGTYSALVGGNDGLVGLVDADYLGSSSGPTGLYAFDRITSGTVLVIPGAATTALWQGMLTYVETYREGTIFCVFDTLANRTAVQVVADTNTILESSEYGAVYWPRVKISNPSVSVFGTDDSITIPPCGPVVGRYAANDRFNGGVYDSPAGLGLGGPSGVLGIVVGLEDDPTGDERHQVLDEKWRDFVYPKRINPIVQLEEGPFHIDGGRTLKSTGNWPHVCQRRGVCGIKASTKHALVYFKHRPNNKENRRRVWRTLDRYCEGEMNKGAFASKEKKTAYHIDVSDQLNSTSVIASGKMRIKLAVAMSTPAEFIEETITADTMAAA